MDMSAAIGVEHGLDELLQVVRELEYELMQLHYEHTDFFSGVPFDNLNDIERQFQEVEYHRAFWFNCVEEQKRQVKRHWIENNRRIIALPTPGSD